MDPSVFFPIVIIGMVVLAIVIFFVLVILDKGADED